MNRLYAIPSTAALGLSLGGCTAFASLAGEWTGVIYEGSIMPMEYSVTSSYYSYAYRAEVSMEIDKDLEIELELKASYSSSGQGYDYSYDYSYNFEGNAESEGQREYSIELELDDADWELELDCVLQERDYLDCNGEDDEVFAFVRE